MPAFGAVVPFSWIFGVSLSGLLHVLGSGRSRAAAGSGPMSREGIPSQVGAGGGEAVERPGRTGAGAASGVAEGS